MKNRNVSLIDGIVFTILGVIVFVNPEGVVKFASYCLGGLLVGLGIYKITNYIIQDRRYDIVNNNEIAFGITAVVLGLIFIFLAGAIELMLRFIVGGWLVVAGLARIADTFYTTDRDAKFYSLIVIGIIFIGLGIYTILVSNLGLSIIGLFMIIYGIIDFISYFVYRNKILILDENEDIVIEGEVTEEEEDEEGTSKEEKVNKKTTKKKTTTKKKGIKKE